MIVLIYICIFILNISNIELICYFHLKSLQDTDDLSTNQGTEDSITSTSQETKDSICQDNFSSSEIISGY